MRRREEGNTTAWTCVVVAKRARVGMAVPKTGKTVNRSGMDVPDPKESSGDVSDQEGLVGQLPHPPRGRKYQNETSDRCCDFPIPVGLGEDLS